LVPVDPVKFFCHLFWSPMATNGDQRKRGSSTLQSALSFIFS
jgi:hypothetical protein